MKRLFAIWLIVFLLLCGMVACKDDAPDGGESSAESTATVTEEPGEPFDQNNEYANDNNAYYDDAWKRS